MICEYVHRHTERQYVGRHDEYQEQTGHDLSRPSAGCAEEYLESIGVGTHGRIAKLELVGDVACVGRASTEEENDDDAREEAEGGEGGRKGEDAEGDGFGDHYCAC